MCEHINRFELKEDGIVSNNDKCGLKKIVETMIIFGLKDVINNNMPDYMFAIGDAYSDQELKDLYILAKKLPNIKYIRNWGEGTYIDYCPSEHITDFIQLYKVNNEYPFEHLLCEFD